MSLKREPVVIVFTILTLLQAINAGLMLGDTFDEETAATIALVVSAVQAAATFYVRSMVAPWESVVSQIAVDGTVKAGPAVGVGGTTGTAGPPPADPPL